MWRGGLIILTAACIHPRAAASNPSMEHPYGSTERLHGNLWGQGVAGKGCFYLLMRSVPGAQCLSASVSAQPAAQLMGRGALSKKKTKKKESLPSDTSLSYLNPGWIAWLPGERGLTRISFCPVGKITNGSEIAVPPPHKSGSLLSCSHAKATIGPQAQRMVLATTSLGM